MVKSMFFGHYYKVKDDYKNKTPHRSLVAVFS